MFNILSKRLSLGLHGKLELMIFLLIELHLLNFDLETLFSLNAAHAVAVSYDFAIYNYGYVVSLGFLD